MNDDDDDDSINLETILSSALNKRQLSPVVMEDILNRLEPEKKSKREEIKQKILKG